MVGVSNLPQGVVLGRLSAKVFAVLERHTAFPWPVLSAQCKRHGLDPVDLSGTELELLIDNLAYGVERFTSPSNGEQVRRELMALLRVQR